MILSTKNYNIFKKHISNRDIDKFNLSKIKRSIQARNLLSIRPILVDSKMHVIDGQHRLEAAKELDVDIFYIIKEESCGEDIILLNTNQKGWRLNDFLNYYISINSEQYIKLYDFMQSKNIELSTALSLLNYLSGKSNIKFKSGTFKMPQNYDDVTLKLLIYKELANYLERKLIGRKEFIRKPNFVRAVLIFLNLENIDKMLFMKKLELNLEWIHRCSTRKDYVDMFKKIYNYKNLNPIL